MKLGSCPKCGSRKVRLGRTFLHHLVRLVHGSRCRYCCSCRRRWIVSENVFSPRTRHSGILLICGIAALTLVYMVNDGWFAPPPVIIQNAVRDNRYETQYEEMMAEKMYVSQGDTDPKAYGRTSAARTPRRAGTVADVNPAYRQLVRAPSQQNGQLQRMLDLLRLVEAYAGGKSPKQLANEIESSDKEALWNKYGRYFASREEARTAYNEFQSRRGEIPDRWPRPVR